MRALRVAVSGLRRALLLAWVAVASVAQARDGWRGDGSGIFADAVPPSVWKAPVWRAPLSTPANASPVLLDDLVIVTEEPATLVAIDAATGKERWRRVHDIASTLPADEAVTVRARLAKVPQLQVELEAARKSYAELRRRQRAGSVDPAALEGASARLATVQDELNALARYRSPETNDVVGWASPTPVADDHVVYEVFGNGVVVADRADGTVAWSRWLGPVVLDHRGHHGQDTASPLLVDGYLIVAHGHLEALDPATGRPVWTGPVYRDFGTPAVVRVDGHPYLACPDGTLVDARTGRQVASGLGDVYYASPVAVGDVVYYTGSTAGHDGGGPCTATAVRLVDTDTGVAVERLWTTTFGEGDQVFSAPVVVDGRLYVATKARYLHTFDAATGALVATTRFDGTGECWAPLVVADHRLWSASIAGRVHVVALDPTRPGVPPIPVDPARTTPRLEGSAVYWRSETALVRYP
ncbi:MAG: PQQ-binding-like beta-propeller repeat protein [Alphaproteobacteria bacterium]|nr:PQQ-binding-like beta-propeller repeat protein [Alphaproteobacteria bacterium]